jgi:hypothetical protein
MLISTPRALPSSGSHSAYGKLLPIMKNVSQFITISSLGMEPSRPIGPVTNGRSSGSTWRPSSALATPAPSSSAASARAPAAPCPIRMATLLPSLRISAALASSPSSGSILGLLHPAGEYTALCIFGGGATERAEHPVDPVTGICEATCSAIVIIHPYRKSAPPALLAPIPRTTTYNPRKLCRTARSPAPEAAAPTGDLKAIWPACLRASLLLRLIPVSGIRHLRWGSWTEMLPAFRPAASTLGARAAVSAPR